MDAPSSSSVRAHLHRFLFLEDQTAVHAPDGSPGSTCESGCTIRERQSLLVLVVWAPPRKKRNQVQHAMNGNTSASDSELTSPTTTTDFEARLERLFVRGRELAGTLIRPEVDILEMGIVEATEAHRRHILAMVPDWHNRPVIMHWARSPCTTCGHRITRRSRR